jgi:gliding motility-associated-like protein
VTPVLTSTRNATVCTNALPYIWNGNPYNAAGTYVDTLTSQAGCDSIATLVLAVNPVLTSSDSVSVCANTLPYVWNSNSYNAPGTYTDTLSTQAGCDSIVTLKLSVIASPKLVITHPAAVCFPKTVDLTAAAITAGSDTGLVYTYWADAANTIPLTNPTAIGVSGTYYIKATATSGCSFTQSVQVVVTINKSALSMRYPPVTASPNVPVLLTARYFGPGFTYLWQPPVGLNSYTIRTPLFNYNSTVEYTITITAPDSSDCPIIDTVQVRMRENAALISSLHVPKAWSPNGDGHNDKLYPLTINIVELKYFRVFNRWGELVFETNVLGHGWDGIYKRVPQVMDVYTWTVEAHGADGRHYKLAGNSVLMR